MAFLQSCGEDETIPPIDPPVGNLYDESTYPMAEWIVAEADQVGMDASKIDEALDYAFAPERNTQGVVVIRHGVIVAERYADDRDASTPATSWSTGKSFVSALIGIAIDRGDISGVDEPVATYITEWADTDKANITIRHLLEMRSGLQMEGEEVLVLYANGGLDGDQVAPSIDRQVVEAPGQRWVYQNANSMLLGEIVARASGMSVTEFADEFLFSKIDMNADWWTDEVGHALTYCCIDATTRAFGRFGLLYARDGQWSGQEVVSPSYVETSTSEYENGSGYGLHWVVNTDNNLFAAAGLHENNIYVFPEQDIVVVRNSIYNQAGTEKVRTGVNFHVTLEPIGWDNVTFLQPIIDGVIE